jgi:hypothetical protein
LRLPVGCVLFVVNRGLLLVGRVLLQKRFMGWVSSSGARAHHA